jgi:uncharacterized protein (DUF362 family)
MGRVGTALASQARSPNNPPGIVPELTRREAAGISALLIAGCSRRRQVRNLPRVCIARANTYDQSLYAQVLRQFRESGLDVRGKNVVLKPNLVEFDPRTTINTHPLVVHAALEACRALGAAKVRIAEGPGHRRPTLDLADAAGYFATIPNFEELFTDLNLDDVSRTRLTRGASKLDSLYLPKTALGADLLISLPKMKTHHWVGATLSLKNLFGLVPGAVYGWPKNILHWAGIPECIADLRSAFPRSFALVEGISGMEGNGPIQGPSKHVGVLVSGGDLVAVDATCCRVMGVDPGKIPYLRLCANRNQTAAENVQQIGESIQSVRTDFAVLPQFRGILLPRPSSPSSG